MPEAPAITTCTMHAFGEEWGVPVAPGHLVACDQPAIALITFACIHEHIDNALACSGCAVDVQMAAAAREMPALLPGSGNG